MSIREVTPEDQEWLKSIWDEPMFGSFSVWWYRYWHQRSHGERWIIYEGKGFAHYFVRRDGMRRIQEILVAPDARRQGIGEMLVNYVGVPVKLRTDCDNVASNAFYRRLGFVPAAKVRAKSGKEMMIYEKW